MKLIIGATGMVGSEICRLLTTKGHKVRAMVRKTSDPEKVKKLEQWGVEVIRGDIRDHSTFDPALSGVTTVITTLSSMPFSYIPGENDIRHVDREGMLHLIDHAERVGVKHFVYTSFSRQIDLDFPLRNAKRTVEKHLMDSGMTYTILRPSCFMEVWLSPAVGFDAENGKVQIYGDGKQPVSYISYKDVARFAVASLDKPAAKNAVLELGGPEQLSQLDAVHIFEQLSGQKFDLSFVPGSALKSQINEATDPMQKSFASLMLCVANGDPIDMKDMMDKFPFKLTSVKEFAQGMIPVA